MTEEQTQLLLRRYLDGEATPEERYKVEAWYEYQVAENPPVLSDAEELVAAARMKNYIKGQTTFNDTHFFKTTWFRYAAVLLFVVATGAYWWSKQQPVKINQPAIAKTSPAPGKEGAVLTLADGTTMVLDSLGNGVIASQHGADILLKNGQLTYKERALVSQQLAYNTVSTPKGRQFQLVLPDGTHVWLNAASSITYPTVFEEGARKITVTGEAYFEVVTDKMKPFLVSVNQAVVQVLGTSFNINAYADERVISATLLEGSIKVIEGTQQQLLLPGEQALLNDGIKIDKQVDTEAVMAWKNGLFNFNHTSVYQVLRQVSRWYDLEVEYEKGVREVYFGGKVRRDVSLGFVLKMLEKSGIGFELKGNHLLVKS